MFTWQATISTTGIRPSLVGMPERANLRPDAADLGREPGWHR